jgi:hypothetical protein
MLPIQATERSKTNSYSESRVQWPSTQFINNESKTNKSASINILCYTVLLHVSMLIDQQQVVPKYVSTESLNCKFFKINFG